MARRSGLCFLGIISRRLIVITSSCSSTSIEEKSSRRTAQKRCWSGHHASAAGADNVLALVMRLYHCPSRAAVEPMCYAQMGGILRDLHTLLLVPVIYSIFVSI